MPVIAYFSDGELCDRLVGGLDVISEMEKVETDAKDKPLVCCAAIPCDM